ncbi:MAG: InlB B-repeat-containing protein, partial [Tannerellaceae bacterium]|nr:InlB B-repeat-containing protein [Tannerellaceae bacterium]
MKPKLRLLAGLLVLATAFTSCDKGADEPEATFTVTFNADGGAPVPQAQTVKAGEIAVAPANPAKQGYVFLFWHLNGATAAYDFATPVTGNITLQAKWEDASVAEYWQVTWVLNGGLWPAGDNHAAQVIKGGVLAEPAAPTNAGKAFDGWYKDAGLAYKINFPYSVSDLTANFTLYAKWLSDSGVTLDKPSLELRTTDRERLTATGDAAVTWSTSDKGVAIVDNQGVVTATGAGKAVITATAGSKSATSNVEVSPSVITGDGTVIWKNGARIEIVNYNAPKAINSLFVYEGDIYVTGTKTDVISGSTTITEYSQAVVIKVECAIKGEPNTLVFTDQLLELNANASYGEDLFIAPNGDIYVSGYGIATNSYNNYYRRALLWKNGKLQPALSDSDVTQSAAVRSVFVAANDVVYAAGNNGYWVNDVVWKNGQPEILNEPQGDVTRVKANSVFVAGGDVYVAGAVYFYPQDFRPKAVLWKNNVPVLLETARDTEL